MRKPVKVPSPGKKAFTAASTAGGSCVRWAWAKKRAARGVVLSAEQEAQGGCGTHPKRPLQRAHGSTGSAFGYPPNQPVPIAAAGARPPPQEGARSLPSRCAGPLAQRPSLAPRRPPLPKQQARRIKTHLRHSAASRTLFDSTFRAFYSYYPLRP